MTWRMNTCRRLRLASVLFSLAGTFILGVKLAPTSHTTRAVAAEPRKAWQGAGKPKSSRETQVEELRRKFPYVSLSARLAYEDRQSREKIVAPKLGADAKDQLRVTETQLGWSQQNDRRAKLLEALHALSVEDFIARQGFGISRVRCSPLKAIDLPEPPSLPFAREDRDDAADNSQRRPSGIDSLLPADLSLVPSADLLTTFNQERGLDFVTPMRWGHVVDRDHVAGFQSHAFWRRPFLTHKLGKSTEAGAVTSRWDVRRLELVSLLKHDKPLAYVSENMPRMEELKEAKTRELTDFEQHSLDKLVQGQEIVSDIEHNQIHMLGAIRAARQCLECHSATRGELLGAFSYDLRRSPPILADNPPPSPAG